MSTLRFQASDKTNANNVIIVVEDGELFTYKIQNNEQI